MNPIEVSQTLLLQAILSLAGIQANGTGTPDRQVEAIRLARGRILSATVIQILSRDRVILEIAGRRYEASGARRLASGQVITVRVSELAPRLELEVLAERTLEQKNLTIVLRALTNSAGTPERQVEAVRLARGQILSATVIQILPRDRVILEIAGQRYEASGARRLTPGQVITVRVSELAPRLELEVLAERTPEQKNLAVALRALFVGSGDITAEAERLSDLIRRLLASPTQQPLLDELMTRLAQRLAPVEISGDPTALSSALQRALAGFGLGFEAAVLKALQGEARARLDTNTLKPLLMQILELLEGTPQKTVLKEAKSLLRTSWKGFAARWSPVMKAANAKVPFSRLGSRLLLAVETALKQGGPGAEGRMRAALKGVRVEIRALARLLPPSDGAAFLRAAEELLLDLGRRIAAGESRLGLLKEFFKGASAMKEKLDALQIMNTVFKERELYQHLLFPTSILGELTEVQIKHFLAGKGKKGARCLTAVILLNLESLGRLRIDALLQERSLYVNISVERPEVVPVVEEMSQEFAEQIEARGFTLARLRCRVDSHRIEEFHHLDLEVLGKGESLIDLQV